MGVIPRPSTSSAPFSHLNHCSKNATLSNPAFRFIETSTRAEAQRASQSCNVVVYTTQVGWPDSCMDTLLHALRDRAPPLLPPNRTAIADGNICLIAFLSPEHTAFVRARASSTPIPWHTIPLQVDPRHAGLFTPRSASKLPKHCPMLLFPHSRVVVFVDFKLALLVPVPTLVSYALDPTATEEESSERGRERSGQRTARPFALAMLRHPCVAHSRLPASSEKMGAAGHGVSAPSWCRGARARDRGWSARDWMLQEAYIVSRKGKTRSPKQLFEMVNSYRTAMDADSRLYGDTALLVWRRGAGAAHLSCMLADRLYGAAATHAALDRDQPALAFLLHRYSHLAASVRMLPPLPPDCARTPGRDENEHRPARMCSWDMDPSPRAPSTWRVAHNLGVNPGCTATKPISRPHAGRPRAFNKLELVGP